MLAQAITNKHTLDAEAQQVKDNKAAEKTARVAAKAKKAERMKAKAGGVRPGPSTDPARGESGGSQVVEAAELSTSPVHGESEGAGVAEVAGLSTDPVHGESGGARVAEVAGSSTDPVHGESGGAHVPSRPKPRPVKRGRPRKDQAGPPEEPISKRLRSQLGQP